MNTVLVTGGSGFIASHCILRLLAAGYQVRTTVRSTGREAVARDLLKTGGADSLEHLSFFVADVESDVGWPQALIGCDYVLHLAAPVPQGIPKHEDELIVPAREGTLRVLSASRAAGVRRVVLTSAISAVVYGHPPQREAFDETYWTDPDADISAYVKSKTVAERAAWDFIASRRNDMEFTVINPVFTLGPVFGADYSPSIEMVKSLLEGHVPQFKSNCGPADVRDVADLHIRAMSHPAAKGERFIAVNGPFLSIPEMAKVLKDHLGETARRVRDSNDPGLRALVPEPEKIKNATHAKARRLLDWAPRYSREQTIVDTAESLARLGLLSTGT